MSFRRIKSPDKKDRKKFCKIAKTTEQREQEVEQRELEAQERLKGFITPWLLVSQRQEKR